MKIAVILFPGMNREEDAKKAVEFAGMEGEVIRWNSGVDLSRYDGYVLPGGWSYEDRIRAGVISAKDPIMEQVKVEAGKGKPVLGICNGCQVLVESGLVPGLEIGKVEVALAPNKSNPHVSGFYCTWVNVKQDCNREIAFNIDLASQFPIAIAHGEGRFVTSDPELLQQLIDNDQIVLRYCDHKGEFKEEFPVNPNGSMYNIAALCNKEGNVMAMMPHPESSSWVKQLPYHEGDLTKINERAPANHIFVSMKKYIEARK